ncbi:rubredoxin [Bradyrhizobium sp. F1.4.3]
MPKPDPELLPIRPRCPECQMRMISTNVVAEANGFEDRTFQCSKCGHIETRRMATGPLALPPDVAGTKGRLKPPE